MAKKKLPKNPMPKNPVAQESSKKGWGSGYHEDPKSKNRSDRKLTKQKLKNPELID